MPFINPSGLHYTGTLPVVNNEGNRQNRTSGGYLRGLKHFGLVADQI